MSEEELEQNFVEIVDENGEVTKCEIYDVIDFENKTYALLLPMSEEDEEETEVIVMEYVLLMEVFIGKKDSLIKIIMKTMFI